MYINPERRGFTLIELLVVIAIIGILSSVVIVSLGTIRSRSQDTAVQVDLGSVRVQAELYHNIYSTYGANAALESSCTAVDNMFSDQVIKNAITDADSENKEGDVICNVSAGGVEYAVLAQLVADSSKYWCVDSASVGKIVPAADVPSPGTVTACP